MANEESQITEGIEREMEACAALSSRSPSLPLAGHESLRKVLTIPSCRKHGERIVDKFRLWQLPEMGDPLRQQRIRGRMLA